MFDVSSVLSSGEYIRMDDSGFKGSLPVPIRPGTLLKLLTRWHPAATNCVQVITTWTGILICLSWQINGLCCWSLCCATQTSARKLLQMPTAGLSKWYLKGLMRWAKTLLIHDKLPSLILARMWVCDFYLPSPDAPGINTVFRALSIYLCYKLKGRALP